MYIVTVECSEGVVHGVSCDTYEDAVACKIYYGVKGFVCKIFKEVSE